VTVSGDVFAFAGTLLTAGVAGERFRSPSGDVLLFGATAWAAFTLSSGVRAMLEGDVFHASALPRVFLSPGKLAHYAILLSGFVLA